MVFPSPLYHDQENPPRSTLKNAPAACDPRNHQKVQVQHGNTSQLYCRLKSRRLGSWKILEVSMWCDINVGWVCVCCYISSVSLEPPKEPWQFYTVFPSHEILLGQLVSRVTIPKPGVSHPRNHQTYSLVSYTSFMNLYHAIILGIYNI